MHIYCYIYIVIVMILNILQFKFIHVFNLLMNHYYIIVFDNHINNLRICMI